MTGSLPADAGDDRALRVNAHVSIPRSELAMRASRASGAGGQHVNRTSSRVEITWNPARSAALGPDDLATLLQRLGSRISDQGDIRVVASDTRSQFQNRELAEERLVELVRSALMIPRERKETRPSRAARQARLDDKRYNSERKQRRNRQRGRWLED